VRHHRRRRRRRRGLRRAGTTPSRGLGNDAIRGDTGDDSLDGGPGRDTIVATAATTHLRRHATTSSSVRGDDVMISSDDSEVDKVNGGDDFDDCLFGAATRSTTANTEPTGTNGI